MRTAIRYVVTLLPGDTRHALDKKWYVGGNRRWSSDSAQLFDSFAAAEEVRKMCAGEDPGSEYRMRVEADPTGNSWRPNNPTLPQE